MSDGFYWAWKPDVPTPFVVEVVLGNAYFIADPDGVPVIDLQDRGWVFRPAVPPEQDGGVAD